MTNEERQLLLTDLCARLPYHPILNWKFSNNTSKDDELKSLSDLDIWWITEAKDCEVKPYLRPLSSMTEEEKMEVRELGVCDDCAFHNDIYDVGISMDEAFAALSWLLERHFDINYLIEKGLALEAPEGMYKIK